jgi:D-3-phosphoglycerate dehydrogenase
VGLVLALLRKTARMNSDVKAGKWNKLMGNLLFGKKAGIVGFGRIGKRVAKMLSAFGAEAAFSDPLVDTPDAGGFAKMQLENLLSWADIVTIHVSGSKVNPLFIGDEEFRLMKDGACIVNVSRGGVLDERALYAALKDGKLSGAALDVFQEEPYCGNLIELENVILTPHIGSYALEARTGMEMDAVKNLIEGIGENPGGEMR